MDAEDDEDGIEDEGPGFDDDQEPEEGKQIMFGDFYKKGEEEFKGHKIVEGEEDVDEDGIFD